MIYSKGNNHFKDNQFSFWEWSAPVLQTPEELLQKVKELRLEGRVVKDIIAIGMGYDWTDDSIADRAHHARERLHPKLRNAIPEEAVLRSTDIHLNRTAEIDEPLLIVFEDGDVLGVSFDEGSCVRMELNTIPITIEPGTNRKNFHANRLFRDMIGKTITEVRITATTQEPDFTGSHGLTLEERLAYIDSFELVYCRETWEFPYLSLRFFPWFDYGEVELIDYSGADVTIPITQVPQIVEGYPAADLFASCSRKMTLTKRLLNVMRKRRNEVKR